MFREHSYSELLLELGLYKKLAINYSDFNSGSYIDQSYDSGIHREATIYTKSYSDDFQHLINFMRSSSNIVGFCPFCHERFSLKVIPIELNKELLKFRVHEAHEDWVDEDHYYDGSEMEMNKRLSILLKKDNGYFDKWVQCTHNSSHLFRFSYHLEELFDDKGERKLTLKKVGQNPSLSDFFSESVKRFRPLLKKMNSHEDFSTGCYMYANGLGIGSYAYLRRVFEKLIMYTFKENEQFFNLESHEFNRLMMGDKVHKLKEYLPSFLTENNRNIYKLLSLGIHQLEEDECKKMFMVLKNAIEVILEEKMHNEEERKRKKEISEALNAFSSELVVEIIERSENN